MSLTRAHAICAMALAVSTAVPLSRADVADNPYTTIVARNPFGLKDPPPPPPPPSNEPPPTPPAKVTLTGLISMFGEPRALLEIFDEPGKGGGTPKKPILREGERMGNIEVVSINVADNTVTIRNSGQETNLTFQIASAGAAPGIPSPGIAPPPLPSLSQANAGSPTVISQNGAQAGGGVTLMGGAAAAAPPATPSVASYGQNTAANYGRSSAPGGPLGSDSGLRSIPSRPLRSVDPGSIASPPPMTRDQAEVYHSAVNELNRQKGLPPLPTGRLMDNPDGAPGNPGGPPEFPQFPRPGPRPPGLPR